MQGGVTSGLLNAVVAEDLPGPGSVFLHADWRYRAPVHPGDTITAEVEVVAAATTSRSPRCDHGHQPGRHSRARRDGRRLAGPGGRRADRNALIGRCTTWQNVVTGDVTTF